MKQDASDMPLLLSVFSCVQKFVDEEVLEFKRDFKDDDKEDDEQENFLLNGWCDEITTLSDLDDQTNGSMCSGVGNTDASPAQAEETNSPARSEGTNADEEISTPGDVVFERTRSHLTSLKQKSLRFRKEARCGVKRATRRFRYTRGLPGKASKRMTYSQNLFLAPSRLPLGRGKRPVWRVSRQPVNMRRS